MELEGKSTAEREVVGMGEGERGGGGALMSMTVSPGAYVEGNLS